MLPRSSFRLSSYLNFNPPSNFGIRQRRCLSSTAIATRFADLVNHATSKFQIYVSNSDDPFVNLSIEHYLLQKSHQDSTILFLYVNRPCVVIGRNQNPWLETNLRFLTTPIATGQGRPLTGASNELPFIELVRRRSGGGTVFHDYGNVNYSVICPTPDFTRDKHAEMIVRAIRPDNPRARVNERHDIVLDQGELLPTHRRSSLSNYHKSAYDPGSFLKVSGSAYKLTRHRSLHHGTCLVSSPNIGSLSRYLRSPAAHYIKARGVDSVRSPVGNVYPSRREGAVEHFKRNAVKAFAQMYQLGQTLDERLWNAKHGPFIETFEHGIFGRVGEDVTGIDSIAAGLKEMKSSDWLYTQTPQFVFSSHPTEEDLRPRPFLPSSIPPSSKVYMKVRNGLITEAAISTSPDSATAADQAAKSEAVLEGVGIGEISAWADVLCKDPTTGGIEGISAVASWLDGLYGKTDMPL